MPAAIPPSSPDDAARALLALRARAEQRQRLSTAPAQVRTPAETEWLVQELHVHQLELELQNEALLEAQTEAEVARVAAHAVHAQYLDLYENAPVAYVTLTPTGVLRHLNHRACDLLDAPSARLTRRRFLLFIAPEDRAAFLRFWQQCLHSTRVEETEVRLLTDAAAERPVRLEGHAVTDPAGERSVRLTLADLTTRYHTDALRTERERRLLDASPAATFIITPEGTVDYLSPQWYAYTGLVPAESLGKPWPALLHPDETDALMDSFTAVLAAGRPWRYAHRLRHSSGEYRWFLSQGTPELGAHGRPVRWYGAHLDIHEQWELHQRLAAEHEQLMHTTTALDHFVYTAAHDLREPLNNLAGLFAELRGAATFQSGDAPQLVDLIDQSVRTLHATLNELTAVAQTLPARAVAPAAVALAPLAAEVLASLSAQVTAIHAQVAFDFAALPAVPVPRALLRSVFYNLLSNALKYAAPGRPARIQLASTIEAGELVLTVQDNGLGIDLAAHGPQLFGRFERFHDHVPGTGLGLYLVQSLVREAGGWVDVESTVGVGTTFRLRFPLVPRPSWDAGG